MQTPQINPGAFEPVVMDGFAKGWEHGQQTREQNMAKAAYAALVRDPSNQKAFEALASVNPEAAQQFKQQQMEQAKAHLGAHYENVLKAGQILRQAKPHDQASWDQARAMAQQAGVDISEAPPLWDEHTAQYAQQISGLADVFAPQTQHNPQLIPVPAGGGVARWNPETQQPEMIIAPNEGGHPAGAPVQSSGPTQQAVDYLRANPNLAAHFDEKYGAGAAAHILGGQAATPPATFP